MYGCRRLNNRHNDAAYYRRKFAFFPDIQKTCRIFMVFESNYFFGLTLARLQYQPF